MKKYILSAIAVAGMFAMTSCEDFLKPTSEGAYTSENYFQNDQQAIDAVDACYMRFLEENCFGRQIMWEQAAANDFVWGRTRSWPELATLSLTGSVGPLNDVWGELTKTQQRANWLVSSLLDKQKSTELTAIEKRSLGEAYFIRALAHFYIAYRYGTGEQGVPFVRFEDFDGGYDYSIPTQQPTVMDNYKMIVDDLSKAEALLPTCEEYSDADFGRAHKAACAGYKAKVYAYWACWDKSQYANVITEVNKMMTQYGRDLADNFTDNFTSDWNKWRNKEYVWAVPGEGAGKGQYGGIEFPGVILDNGAWGYMNGWGQFKPSLDIYKEMDQDSQNLKADVNADGIVDIEDNIRLRNSILEYNQPFKFFGDDMRFYSIRDIESGFMIAKYLEPFTHDDPIANGYVGDNGDWPVCRINFPILRFADCLLLRAEAKLATGDAAGATQDINKVRNRSNVKDLDHTATWADLYHERRVELAFEHSDHLYDLKRWAVGGNAEIKALAIAELEAHPRVRHYVDRADPTSTFEEGPYLDYQEPAKKWEDYKMVFPYRDTEIARANGALKQNKNY